MAQQGVMQCVIQVGEAMLPLHSTCSESFPGPTAVANACSTVNIRYLLSSHNVACRSLCQTQGR